MSCLRFDVKYNLEVFTQQDYNNNNYNGVRIQFRLEYYAYLHPWYVPITNMNTRSYTEICRQYFLSQSWSYNCVQPHTNHWGQRCLLTEHINKKGHIILQLCSNVFAGACEKYVTCTGRVMQTHHVRQKLVGLTLILKMCSFVPSSCDMRKCGKRWNITTFCQPTRRGYRLQITSEYSVLSLMAL